jgi:hypothetical protein
MLARRYTKFFVPAVGQTPASLSTSFVPSQFSSGSLLGSASAGSESGSALLDFSHAKESSSDAGPDPLPSKPTGSRPNGRGSKEFFVSPLQNKISSGTRHDSEKLLIQFLETKEICQQKIDASEHAFAGITE